jgi:hypothetical protein
LGLKATLAALLLTLASSGCAGGSSFTLGAPGEATRVAVPVEEAYARIARGAHSCWFSATGPLRRTHIFHADVDPPTRGGAAEIGVLERDATQPSPWGRRVFRIELTASDGSTAIEVANLALPEALAARMRADVFEWLDGRSACQGGEGAGPAGLLSPAKTAGS